MNVQENVPRGTGALRPGNFSPFYILILYKKAKRRVYKITVENGQMSIDITPITSNLPKANFSPAECGLCKSVSHPLRFFQIQRVLPISSLYLKSC